MEDFDWNWEYLERHQIHAMWEECVQTLIRQQPCGQKEIAESIIQTIEAREKRRKNPYKTVAFVLGLKMLPVNDIINDFVRQHSNEFCVVDVPPSTPLQVVEAMINRSDKDNVLVTGFPSSLTDLIVFEAKSFQSRGCIFLTYHGFQAMPSTEGQNSDQKGEMDDFIYNVNPLVSYFRAVGRCAEVQCDSAEVNPFQVMKRFFLKKE